MVLLTAALAHAASSFFQESDHSQSLYLLRKVIKKLKVDKVRKISAKQDYSQPLNQAAVLVWGEIAQGSEAKARALLEGTASPKSQTCSFSPLSNTPQSQSGLLVRGHLQRFLPCVG